MYRLQPVYNDGSHRFFLFAQPPAFRTMDGCTRPFLSATISLKDADSGALRDVFLSLVVYVENYWSNSPALVALICPAINGYLHHQAIHVSKAQVTSSQSLAHFLHIHWQGRQDMSDSSPSPSTRPVFVTHAAYHQRRSAFEHPIADGAKSGVHTDTKKRQWKRGRIFKRRKKSRVVMGHEE